MARVKTGKVRVQRHRKILKAARGYQQGRRRLFRRAKEAVTKAREHAYRHRRTRKRDFRRLWIQRINAASRLNGLSYSRLIHGLGLAGITLDRRMLADIAVRDPKAFTAIMDVVKDAIEANKSNDGGSGGDGGAEAEAA